MTESAEHPYICHIDVLIKIYGTSTCRPDRTACMVTAFSGCCTWWWVSAQQEIPLSHLSVVALLFEHLMECRWAGSDTAQPIT